MSPVRVADFGALGGLLPSPLLMDALRASRCRILLDAGDQGQAMGSAARTPHDARSASRERGWRGAFITATTAGFRV
jgi:hypothetical protein